MGWRDNYREALRITVLDWVAHGDGDDEDAAEARWWRMERLIEDYADNLRAEQTQTVWLCVADTKSRCTRSSSVNTDHHGDCGEFDVSSAPKIAPTVDRFIGRF